MLKSNFLMNRRQFTTVLVTAACGSLLRPKLFGQDPVASARQQRAAKAARFSGPGCFGIHYDLQPDSADPMWERDLTAGNLRETWKRVKPDWIQCDCKGSAGYATYPTKVGYPMPGLKNDPLRIHRDVTRELGLPLLVHFCGIWDLQASVHHRDWTRRDGGRADTGKMCVRSPYVHELLIPQMLEVATEYEVDGFWVDGDFWTMEPCYCRRCREAFEAETGIVDPPRRADDANWPRWLAFHRKSYLQYAKAYVDAVHEKKPDCLVCVNWLYSAAIPDPMSIDVDFLSGDAGGDDQISVETRFFESRGLPWNVMTWGFIAPPYENTGGLNKSAAAGQFRALTEICQGAAESLAVGGGAIVFARPTATGRLVSWEHDELAKVAEFVHARRAASQNTVGVPQAAVLNSGEALYATSTKVWNVSGHLADMPALSGAVQALLYAGYSTDVLNEETLRRRISEYGLVVIPEASPISPSLQRALAKYVEGGGRVVLSGAFVATDSALAELAGVEPDGAPLQGYYYLPSGEESAQIQGPWQPVKLNGAELWAELLSTPESTDRTGVPAITLRKTRGQVAVIHGRAFAGYTRDRSPQLGRTLTQLFRAMWPNPAVLLDSVETGLLTTAVRKQGARWVIHLMNRTITSQRESTVRRHVERLPPVGPVRLKLQLPARPAAVSCVPADAAQPTWDWANGVATVSVPSVEIHSALVVDP